ncbi:MAG: N-acetylmuramoyl-L-alanine amidase [Proteobacteria bacterium]|nr:N-acetylmuramoyl-L-alanine amidase [Pseudomonadota bacterium]
MNTDYQSPNCGARKPEQGHAPEIDTLVIHYTGMMPTTRARDWLCDPASQVSAHYLLDEDGTSWRLVAEGDRAWHAGVGCWRGWRDINSRSIGIELSNPGHDYGYRDFPDAQIAALIALAGDILARHPIPAHNVVAHSDIAPDRKIDPGELFPWARLAAAGVGLWPDANTAVEDKAPVHDAPLVALSEIGYDTDRQTAKAVISAFQRRFRPSCFDGALDDETKERIAQMHSLVAASSGSA